MTFSCYATTHQIRVWKIQTVPNKHRFVYYCAGALRRTGTDNLHSCRCSCSDPISAICVGALWAGTNWTTWMKCFQVVQQGCLLQTIGCYSFALNAMWIMQTKRKNCTPILLFNQSITSWVHVRNGFDWIKSDRQIELRTLLYPRFFSLFYISFHTNMLTLVT